MFQTFILECEAKTLKLKRCARNEKSNNPLYIQLSLHNNEKPV